MVRERADRSSWACPTTGRSSATAAGPSTRCGSGARRRTEDFNFLEFSRGDFFDAVHEKVAAESLTRVLYPDDSTPRGKGLAVRPGVFPGRLLAGRHRRAVPPPGQRLARPARQGRHPAQRHPPGAGRRRADADPARPGSARLGRGVGPDRPDPGLHQPHAACPRRWRPGRSPSSRSSCPATSRSSTRSTAASSTTCARRYPGDEDRVRRVSLIQEGPEKRVRMANLAVVGSHSTNGVAEIHSRLLRATVAAGPRRAVPRAVQQQDQRSDPPALAPAGQPRPCRA